MEQEKISSLFQEWLSLEESIRQIVKNIKIIVDDSILEESTRFKEEFTPRYAILLYTIHNMEKVKERTSVMNINNKIRSLFTNITYSINRLENLGLVFSSCPGDNRRRDIFLTKKGREIIRKMEEKYET